MAERRSALTSKLRAELTFRIMDGRKLVGKVSQSTSFKPKLWKALPYYLLFLAMQLADDGFAVRDELLEDAYDKST